MKLVAAVPKELRSPSIRVLILAVSAFYCVLPMVIHGGLPFAHDTVFHAFQAGEFSRSLHEGILYPRWLPDSNSGYGSPNFIFYAPLSYYLSAAIGSIVPSFAYSMIAAVWIGFFLSGIAMYAATAGIFQTRGSLLAAIVYQMLPFHLSNLYVRGTFAELFAYAWFPLIIYFLYDTLRSGKRSSMAGLSISYAGLILTHLVSGFIFSFVMAAFIVYNFPKVRAADTGKTLLAIFLGLGLSAYYFVPLMFERKLVQIDYLTKCAVGDYRKNFLFLPYNFREELIGFYLPLHIGVILEVLLCLFLARANRGNTVMSPDDVRRQRNFFIYSFFAAFTLTTPLSIPVWKAVPGFPTLQFPWRWVPVMELSVCLLLGNFSAGRAAEGKPVRKKVSVFYIVAAILLSSFVTISTSKIFPGQITEKIMDPQEIKRCMDPPVEYTPVWVSNLRAILREEKVERAAFMDGSASLRVVTWESESRLLAVNALTSSVLRVATFYYPGWKAELDGKPVPIRIERGTGAMLVDIPPGKAILNLHFSDTPLRKTSLAISLISLLGVGILIIAVRGHVQREVADSDGEACSG